MKRYSTSMSEFMVNTHSFKLSAHPWPYAVVLLIVQPMKVHPDPIPE